MKTIPPVLLGKKIERSQCLHGCNQKFKSRKQKILHHNKLDRECREVKYKLICLIEEFQSSIGYLLPKTETISKSQVYSYLLYQFKKTKKTIIDKDQYEGIIRANWTIISLKMYFDKTIEI